MTNRSLLPRCGPPIASPDVRASRHPPAALSSPARRNASMRRRPSQCGPYRCSRSLVAVTSPGVTSGITHGMPQGVARMSRDVAKVSRCRGVSRKIVRAHKASTVTSRLDQRCDITKGSHRGLGVSPLPSPERTNKQRRGVCG